MIALTVDPGGAESPFEQVRRQIASAAADGTLAPGHRLPTVRQLAADLGLAVNTVARAYRELEGDGVIVTQGRRGTFVASRSETTSAEVTASARTLVGQARREGLSLDETLRLVETAWPR